MRTMTRFLLLCLTMLAFPAAAAQDTPLPAHSWPREAGSTTSPREDRYDPSLYPLTHSMLAEPAEKCPLLSGSDLSGGEFRCAKPDRGFAIIQNLDHTLGHPATNGQSVILIAPSLRNSQSWKWKRGEECPKINGQTIPGPACTPIWCGGYSALLNNGMTDGGYWLQVGLHFTNRADPLHPLGGNDPKDDPKSDCKDLPLPGSGNPFSPDGMGWVVFTGSQLGLIAHKLCVPYVAGHHYYTTITYTNGVWWTCAADIQTPSTYRCRSHGGKELGTHLIRHRSGTNVFFENVNKEAGPHGLPYQLVAYDAKTYVNGIGHQWSNEATFTQHSCKDSRYPPEQAIVENRGLSKLDGYAFFNANYLPPYCE